MRVRVRVRVRVRARVRLRVRVRVRVRIRVDRGALARERLGEVLGRLGLAGARGAGGRAAHAQVERAGERHVALVGERSDDEAHRIAQVLVAVGEARVGLADDAVVGLLLPVVALVRVRVRVRVGVRVRAGSGSGSGSG